MRTLLLAAAAVLHLASVAECFYLPGVAPRTFKRDQAVKIKVQTLVSSESQLQFDFYQLPFCKPAKIIDLPENLGEALAGEKAHTSNFKIRMRKDEYCKTLCRQTYTPAQMEEFQDFAILDYRVNMRLDNLPLAEITKFYYDDRPDQTLQTYNLGVPLGAKLHEEVHADEAVAEHYVLNNHLRFKILYHKASKDADASQWDGAAEAQARASQDPSAHDDPSENVHHYMRGNLIVGFTAAPYSIEHTFAGPWNATCAPNCQLTTCLPGPQGGFDQHKPQRIDTAAGGTVIWTYDVVWEESDVKWASRWDVYLQMTDDKIHWFSIINSFVILIFLTAIVVMIFSRILKNDLSQYNADEEMDAAALREETGWKLLHGDVFRVPPYGLLLAVFVATGWQLLSMAASTLALAALGFLSPSNRGSLLEAVLLLYLLSGVASGFVAAMLAKLFANEDRMRLTFMTALVFPAVCATIFFVINIVVWAHHSSMAVPFGTFVAVVLLWFVISLPLVFFGAYWGFRKEVISVPCRTNQIPREIPPQIWYQTLVPSLFVGGLLPFGAVFVELFFILSSIWQHRFYYMFGFLCLVFLVLVFSCAMICVILCYLHLCSEDYRWWWRSFWTGGATGVYLFAYGAYHYFARTHKMIDFLSSFIYFGYLFLSCYAFAVMTAAVGFTSCFIFVHQIYGSVKID